MSSVDKCWCFNGDSGTRKQYCNDGSYVIKKFKNMTVEELMDIAEHARDCYAGSYAWARNEALDYLGSLDIEVAEEVSCRIRIV